MICEPVGHFEDRAWAEAVQAEVSARVRRPGVRVLVKDGGPGWGRLRYTVAMCWPGKVPPPPSEREFWERFVAGLRPDQVVHYEPRSRANPTSPAYAPHTRDEDCTLGPDECCVRCGVYHGGSCPSCGGKGFHRDDCPDWEGDVEVRDMDRDPPPQPRLRYFRQNPSARENPAYYGSRTATRMARIFHHNDPYWEERVGQALPQRLRLRGEMTKIGYRSDKLIEPGDREGDVVEYIHDHDPGVMLYEAADSDRGEVLTPPEAWRGRSKYRTWPTQWACLGPLWKLEFVEDRTGHRVEAAIPKGMWLLCSPDSRLLVCLHPQTGFHALICGGKMHVTAAGIEG